MAINHKENIALIGFVGATMLSGALLTLPSALADDVVDTITITVPTSCSMSSTIATGDEHTAEINNGQHDSSIGETMIKAFCNDNEGFAIYAIGYTDNELGKNVLTNSTLGSTHDIATGTNLDGANSSWAMKLSTITSPTPQYPIIIAGSTDDTLKQTGDADFSNFTNVPDDYKKVAYRTAATDVNSEGSNTAEGSTLKTTYQAYISPTQASGEYTGQVKYTMVHPHNAPVPLPAGKIGVNYNANGSTFTGGATKNEVVYATSPMYIATNPEVVETSNLTNGEQSGGSYASDEHVLQTKSFSGASKVRVVIDYGLTDEASITVVEGTWGGWDESDPTGTYDEISTWDLGGNITGTKTYTFDSDTVTVEFWAYNEATSGYDYGMYAKFYPIYSTEQTDTEETEDYVSAAVNTGTYATTTDWYGSWYADINNTHYDFLDEMEVKTFLGDNVTTLSGTTIDLYRGLTFTEAYTRANKSQDGGYYKQQELTKSMCNIVAITQNQTLKDIRDSNTYLVGKLKDGNCWMLDNLALDPTDATTAQNMNETNTNASAEAINNLLHGGSTTTGWSNTAVANVTSNFYDGGYTVPRINNQSKDTLVTSYGLASTNGQAKVGIYYNYCAASASTYCYASGQGVDVPDTIMDAPQDICPAGWRMPTGGPTGEYLAVAQKYSSTATETDSLQYNLSTPLSGYFGYSSANGQGSGGEWWSSTYNNSVIMYYLGVDPTNVDPDFSSNCYFGRSLRCLVGE